jgi:hypothetical protein
MGMLMAWRQFSAGELTVDVQFGDPITLIVVGEVDGDSCRALLDALETAAATPGRPRINVNLVLARFADGYSMAELMGEHPYASTARYRFTHELSPS